MKDRPPGWDLNPSAWRPRLAVFALSAIVTIGAVSHPIEARMPFDEHALLFATLGVLSILGSSERWMKIPWLVLLYGFVAGPLNFANAVSMILRLAASEFLDVRLFLQSFIALVPMGIAAREVLAALQHVRRESQRGFILTRALFGLSPKQRKREQIRRF